MLCNGAWWMGEMGIGMASSAEVEQLDGMILAVKHRVLAQT